LTNEKRSSKKGTSKHSKILNSKREQTELAALKPWPKHDVDRSYANQEMDRKMEGVESSQKINVARTDPQTLSQKVFSKSKSTLTEANHKRESIQDEQKQDT